MEKTHIVVVGATPEESSHVKGCLPDWELANVSLNAEETVIADPIPAEARMILVYARKEHKNTLAICEHLRNSPVSSATPILLAIGRYEITQGNAVKGMGNAAYSGHIDIVKLLLDHKADVNAKTAAGHTALMNAVYGEHTETVQLLKEAGAME